MFRVWTLGLMLASAIILVGCSEAKKPLPGLPAEELLPKQAQPRLRTIKLWIGAEEVVAEVAMTGEQQRTGMMFRTNIAENEGMLFIHPQPRQASYWMMNCPLPLSIAFIGPDGLIQEIHDLQPHNTNSVVSASHNILFALETRQGWFQRHNIAIGTVVRTERGPLVETFFQKRGRIE